LEPSRAHYRTRSASALGAYAGKSTLAAPSLRSRLMHQAWSREWPKLLRARAVEAYRRTPPPTAESKLRLSVKDLLARAAGAEGCSAAMPGWASS